VDETFEPSESMIRSATCRGLDPGHALAWARTTATSLDPGPFQGILELPLLTKPAVRKER